jgi:hypothetical protein
MNFPNSEFAQVAERKVTHYLLDPAHPVGGSKAAFFLRHGFTRARWQELADALRRHARDHQVVETEQTRHGVRYVIDGQLVAPNADRLNIRSAWYIDAGGRTPRFVTAHPLPKP